MSVGTQWDSEATELLLDRVKNGDATAIGELMAKHRPALVAFVQSQLDELLRRKVEASDVVQDAQTEMARRLVDYLERRPMPFTVWARKTAYERVIKTRREMRADRRDVMRETARIDSSSVLIAQSLAAPGPTPSQDAIAHEEAERVARAIQELPELDRDILTLRHMEGLSHADIGSILGIEETATRQRYGRALFRLQKVLGLTGKPGSGDD